VKKALLRAGVAAARMRFDKSGFLWITRVELLQSAQRCESAFLGWSTGWGFGDLRTCHQKCVKRHILAVWRGGGGDVGEQGY